MAWYQSWYLELLTSSFWLVIMYETHKFASTMALTLKICQKKKKKLQFSKWIYVKGIKYLTKSYYLHVYTNALKNPLNKNDKLNGQSLISVTYIIVVLLDDWLVETRCLFKLAFLHEENVSDVELPHVVFIAELHRLTENLFYLLVVFHVPVNLCLLH